ncbi:hypothetical protein SMMN14_05211 [Sphaerulina musiva]
MGKIGVSFVDLANDVSVTSQLGCESVECIGGDFDFGLAITHFTHNSINQTSNGVKFHLTLKKKRTGRNPVCCPLDNP